MTASARRHLSSAVVLAAACALLAAGCAGTPDAKPCIAGTQVFCNCIGGFESGTQECLPSGESFGPCQPCTAVLTDTGPDIEEEPDVEEDLIIGTDAVTEADAGADAGSDTVVDAGPTLGDGKCPGPVLVLDGETDVEFSGSTAKTLANTGGEGICSSGSASHDAAFVIQAAVRGRLSVGVAGVGKFDPMLYLRNGTCGGPQVACSDATGAGSSEALEAFVQPDKPLHLFVDGKPGQSGAFQLQLHLDPGTFCGDGLIDSEEACDDGNSTADDGCSAKCQPDGFPVEAATCPGQAVHVWSLPVDVSATTTKFANTYKGLCGGGGGRDSVYAVTVHRTGKLIATVGKADFDTVLYARSTSCTVGKELGCSNNVKGLGGDLLSVPVTMGQTVYLFVDGYKYGKGTFHLQLQVD